MTTVSLKNPDFTWYYNTDTSACINVSPAAVVLFDDSPIIKQEDNIAWLNRRVREIADCWK